MLKKDLEKKVKDQEAYIENLKEDFKSIQQGLQIVMENTCSDSLEHIREIVNRTKHLEMPKKSFYVSLTLELPADIEESYDSKTILEYLNNKPFTVEEILEN